MFFFVDFLVRLAYISPRKLFPIIDSDTFAGLGDPKQALRRSRMLWRSAWPLDCRTFLSDCRKSTFLGRFSWHEVSEH